MASVTGCKGLPQLGETLLKLDEIEMNFDVKHFYAKEKRTLSEIDEKTGFRVVENDTLYEDREKTKVIGVQYNMGGWNRGEKLAVLGNTYYNPIDMMTDENGTFMALCSVYQPEPQSSDKEMYDSVIQYLSEKYGNPELCKRKIPFLEGQLIRNYATWSLNDKTITVLFMSGDVEYGEKPHSAMAVFIMNNEYKDILLKSNLSIGHWIWIDEINQR